LDTQSDISGSLIPEDAREHRIVLPDELEGREWKDAAGESLLRIDK